MPLPTFIESPRFDESISYGSSGGPSFRTEVFVATSGAEQRNMLWANSKAKYNVSYGIRDKADMNRVLAFFYNVRGRAIGFRFKDWADYELIDQQIGVGNSTLTQFQIIKTYTVGSQTFTRTIYKPVVNTITVKVNNVLQSGSAYSVDGVTGIITFVAAPNGAIVVNGEFDVPVRFDTDEMPATHEAFLAQSWSSIPLVEIPKFNQS